MRKSLLGSKERLIFLANVVQDKAATNEVVLHTRARIVDEKTISFTLVYAIKITITNTQADVTIGMLASTQYPVVFRLKSASIFPLNIL